MKKLVRYSIFLMLICLIIAAACIVRDYQQLHNSVIRLHVVANSDSDLDQQQKLLVRDAVLNYLQSSVDACSDQEQAQQYFSAQLAEIESVANHALKSAGSDNIACVSLQEEPFETRYYDTFTLPAGIYSALRINIGEANGKNWWCVVFPSLCLPTDVADFEDTAAGAGFNERQIKTIVNQDGYEIRFYLLDLLGKIENFFKTYADDL